MRIAATLWEPQIHTQLKHNKSRVCNVRQHVYLDNPSQLKLKSRASRLLVIQLIPVSTLQEQRKQKGLFITPISKQFQQAAEGQLQALHELVSLLAFPKIVCFPLRKSAFPKVMKNWLPWRRSGSEPTSLVTSNVAKATSPRYLNLRRGWISQGNGASP